MPEIDLASVLNIAHTGILRASVFLGFGVNAAHDENFRDYSLNRESAIQIAPPQADHATLAAYKGEFERWIIASGVRELIETFAVFIDRVHGLCLMIATGQGLCTSEKARRQVQKFERKGLGAKLHILKTEFGFMLQHAECLHSINEVRNCLTHRRGIVGPEDCPDSNVLAVQWFRLEIFYDEPDGIPHVIDTPIRPDAPVTLPEGASLKARYAAVTRTFAKGSSVLFTPAELHEICLFAAIAVEDFRLGIGHYAERVGIPVLNAANGIVDSPQFLVEAPEEQPDGTKMVRFQLKTS